MRKVHLAGALGLLALVSGAGCSSSAVGVDECRRIERARCAAGRSCALGIDSDDDADACDRFARDHCLHGLPLDSAPTTGKIDACVRAIDAAGECAKEHGAAYGATNCAISGGVTSASASVCEIIQDPEEAVACGFLLSEPKPAVSTDSGASSPRDAGSD
ncbi:MAG TPA: hypothetical protein VHE30_05380 [Polyangiaceae bacterium]|nr:hypothetical protein [Polyangiaceae bacterium]